MAQAQGGRLQIVASADEALRFSRAHPTDLWVVNTKLPGLSGTELCGLLKARSPQVPVYLVTDQYTPEGERAAWQARATLFGCKPAHHDWLGEWLENQPSRIR